MKLAAVLPGFLRDSIRRCFRSAPEVVGVTEHLTFVIGAEASSETFHISEELIKSHSSYIKETMSRPCREEMTKIVTIRNTLPALFKLYILFLQTGLLWTTSETSIWPCNHAAILPHLHGPHPHVELKTLQCLYHLGWQLEDVDFKDAIMDAYRHIQFELFYNSQRRIFMAPDVVKFFYQYSDVNSGVRKFMVDWAMRVVDVESYLEGKGGHIFQEGTFEYDLALAVKEREGEEEMRLEDILQRTCEYHDHGARKCYRESMGKCAN